MFLAIFRITPYTGKNTGNDWIELSISDSFILLESWSINKFCSHEYLKVTQKKTERNVKNSPSKWKAREGSHKPCQNSETCLIIYITKHRTIVIPIIASTSNIMSTEDNIPCCLRNSQSPYLLQFCKSHILLLMKHK